MTSLPAGVIAGLFVSTLATRFALAARTAAQREAVRQRPAGER